MTENKHAQADESPLAWVSKEVGRQMAQMAQTLSDGLHQAASRAAVDQGVLYDIAGEDIRAIVDAGVRATRDGR